MGKLRCLKPLLTGLLVMIFSVAAACALTDTQTPAPEDATISADADGAFGPEDSADDGETTGYVRPAKTSDSGAVSTDDGGDTTAPVVSPGASDSDSISTDDGGDTTAPVEPDSDADATDDGLTSEYVWLGAFDSADAYADDGETTGYVRPAKTSGSGAVSTGDSGSTTAPVVRPGASDSGAVSTGDSGASTGDGGDTTAPVVRPSNSGSGAASTVDDGSTTGYVRPGKTSNSGKTSADSGDTVANPSRPADSGQTSAPPADSDEALYAPERPPASDSGQTTAPAQPSNSGQTPAVRPSNDDGETTGYVRPVAGKNSNSGKNTDSGDTTAPSPTVPENPENMLPVNTPTTPTTPRENPENQLPSNTPATPVTPATPAAPVNPSYGTLPNKSPYQMTISDVYTPGRTTGQYITYQGSRIPIYAGVQTRNVYSGDFVWRTGHRLRYLGSRYNAQFGVDVSAYQNRDRANGTINWAAAKADGVQFAMIRVGLRGTSTGALREDAYYARNIDGAMAQGIQTGAYIFSQATTIAEAIEEADFVIARLRGHKINGPVSIDWEMKDRSYRVYGTSTEMATACAVAFCKRVAAAGYTPMVYNSRYVAYIKYDQGALAPYMMWYPQYSPTSDTYPYPNLYYQMDYWQFTDSAVVEGIGTKIDANIWFKPKG